MLDLNDELDNDEDLSSIDDSEIGNIWARINQYKMKSSLRLFPGL